MKKTLLILLMALALVGTAFATVSSENSATVKISSTIDAGESIKDTEDAFAGKDGLYLKVYYVIGSDTSTPTEIKADTTISNQEAKISSGQTEGFTEMNFIVKAAAQVTQQQTLKVRVTTDGFKKTGSSSSLGIDITPTGGNAGSTITATACYIASADAGSQDNPPNNAITVTATVGEAVQFTNVGNFEATWAPSADIEAGIYTADIKVVVIAN